MKFQVEWLPDTAGAKQACADLREGLSQLPGPTCTWCHREDGGAHRGEGPTDISTRGCPTRLCISQLRQVQKGEGVIVTFLADDNFSLEPQAQIIELVSMPVF